MRPDRGGLLVAMACVVVMVTPGCTPRPVPGGGASNPPSTSTTPAASSAAPPVSKLDKPVTLRVLAGSEVKDMAEVMEEASKATNVRLTFEFTGTLDGSREVASGRAERKYDAVWFPSNRYLSLLPGASKRLGASTKIMASPVALGLRQDIARKLGWDKKPPTWRDIAAAAEAEKFTFGMTDPSASNSGFSALVGVATALAGGGTAIDAGQVNAVAPELRRLFGAQTLTAGSSGWLADQFVERSGKPGGPDGIVNYESVLLSLNRSGGLPSPLTVVVPTDGVVTSDYPLTLLSGADEKVRDAHAALTGWLRTPDGQRLIMAQTSRRPAVPGVELEERFGDQLLLELPFPAQRAVVDDLLTAYQNTIRRAAQTIYVLDLSGSMRGARIEAMREALISLAGGEGEIRSSGIAGFRSRETVTLIGYSSQVRRPQTFTIPADGSARVLADIRAAARDLEPSGNTATYSALRAAYKLAARQTAERPGALTTVVLMTDGETNRGIAAADFRAYYRRLPPAARAAPTFTVKFGPADPKALAALARLTGGRLFRAGDNRLVDAFEEIRAYQ